MNCWQYLNHACELIQLHVSIQVNIITHIRSFYTYIHSFPGPVSERTLLDSQRTSSALQTTLLPSQRTSLALRRTSLPSQTTLLPRYVDQPFRPLQIGIKSTKGQDVDNGENIYEDVGPRPLPALPEEDYESNGYICRVDSIPDSKPAPLGKEKCYTISSS